MSGLKSRHQILRHDVVFDESNDHNPLVLEECPVCEGSGKVSERHVEGDAVSIGRRSCQRCNGSGHMTLMVPYFNNDATPVHIAPSATGWIKCPCCGWRFCARDKNVWTGRRHARCGQRIVITAVAQLVAIFVAQTKGAPMESLSACGAIAGRGLEGDRYHGDRGTWSSWPQDHELTLIESEAVEAVVQTGFAIGSGAMRRNLVTRNVRLNDLVGKEFQIGAVLCRGTRLCDPCGYLEKHLAMPGIKEALANRGGLRAIIVTSGVLKVGDVIEQRAPAST